MSTITSLKPISSNRFTVYIEYEPAFVLTSHELSQFHLTEGSDISQSVLDELLERVLPERGRRYLLSVIAKTDKSEGQMRESLRNKGYPEQVIDTVIEFGKANRFLDDRRYAAAYIECMISRKGSRAIQYELHRRGISQALIDELLISREGADEASAITALLSKRHPARKRPDYKEEQKLVAFFARRGFSYDSIRESFRNYFSD